jgi:GTP:adenosylcobinamide-phosphate guanylyltransferase
LLEENPDLALNNPRQVIAILLARGFADEFSNHAIKYKALLRISGRPMVDWVLRALQSAEIERIFIIQDADMRLEEVLSPSYKNVFVNCSPRNTRMTDSLICGAEAILEYYPKEEVSQLVIMTVPCDIPLANAKNFNTLIHQSRDQDADVFFTAMKLDRLKASYPNRRFHSMYLKDLKGMYTVQNICFSSGKVIGFAFENDGRRRLEVHNRDGEELTGLADMIEGLRKRRHGLLFWSIAIYRILLRRLLIRGNFITFIKMIFDFLNNNLTTDSIRRGLLAAFNLEFGLLESDTETFSGDIDGPKDMVEVLGLELGSYTVRHP